MFWNEWGASFINREEAFASVGEYFSDDDLKNYLSYVNKEEIINALLSNAETQKKWIDKMYEEAKQEFFDVNYWWEEDGA